MTNDELDAIRARDAACAVPKAPIEAVQWAQSNADRRALLAEVDRLREVFASGASTMAQATDEIERLRREAETDNHNLTHQSEVIAALRDWQRRAVVELTLAQYRLRDHPDQDGFNNMRALIEEAQP